jgi:plasmid stabilization system protein ParE
MMGHRRVIFNRLAIREFREARDWYALRSPSASSNFVRAVDAAVERILNNYDALSIVIKDFRRVRIEKYPIRFNLLPTHECRYSSRGCGPRCPPPQVLAEKALNRAMAR